MGSRERRWADASSVDQVWTARDARGIGADDASRDWRRVVDAHCGKRSGKGVGDGVGITRGDWSSDSGNVGSCRRRVEDAGREGGRNEGVVAKSLARIAGAETESCWQRRASARRGVSRRKHEPAGPEEKKDCKESVEKHSRMGARQGSGGCQGRGSLAVCSVARAVCAVGMAGATGLRLRGSISSQHH